MHLSAHWNDTYHYDKILVLFKQQSQILIKQAIDKAKIKQVTNT